MEAELLGELKKMDGFDVVVGIQGGAYRSGVAVYLRKTLQVKDACSISITNRAEHSYRVLVVTEKVGRELGDLRVLLVDDGVFSLNTVRMALCELKMENHAEDITVVVPVVQDPYSSVLTGTMKIHCLGKVQEHRLLYCESLVYPNDHAPRTNWH